MKTERLVAKPDQMIGGRGKAGLIAVNKSFNEVKAHSGGRAIFFAFPFCQLLSPLFVQVPFFFGSF